MGKLLASGKSSWLVGKSSWLGGKTFLVSGDVEAGGGKKLGFGFARIGITKRRRESGSWGGEKRGFGFARIGIAKRRRELGKARSCSR